MPSIDGLPYITGGGAYGNVKATAIDIPTGSVLGTASKNQLGWPGAFVLSRRMGAVRPSH